jgi:hypothetical protein
MIYTYKFIYAAMMMTPTDLVNRALAMKAELNFNPSHVMEEKLEKLKNFIMINGYGLMRKRQIELMAKDLFGETKLTDDEKKELKDISNVLNSKIEYIE